MTDLPTGKLRYFPVQYHRYMIAAGIEPTSTKTLRGRACSTSMRFGNSFSYGRNGGRHRHNAIDIFGALGLPIVAACRGSVVTEW